MKKQNAAEEIEELGELCTACGKPVAIAPHVMFFYDATAFIWDLAQTKILDLDVGRPATGGGHLHYCYECATSGRNPFIDPGLLKALVEAQKILKAGKASGAKNAGTFWGRVRGVAARFRRN